ncbi:MAG: hypothetical protein QOD33_671 [Pyrinomonadaceae bacterium]|jgi:hypothetical protein|nr:hypothetical protein [Pyrinomonadaceae bacterium]
MVEHPIRLDILDDLEGIERGRCTLFLGAGASQTAHTSSGEKAPSGDDLSKLIVKNFLRDDDSWSLSLENASSLAISAGQINRVRIEDFVKDKLSRLEPSAAHKKIPWFIWRAIVTTNYDRLIEEAYQDPTAVQALFPILSEDDLPRLGRSDADTLTLLKPHGCISQPKEMCLSTENIQRARQDRRLLFSYIEMLHFEGPVIYIGYSLRDTHVLSMIYELTQRLGVYRRPILFVTHQDQPRRADIERRWFRDAFNSAYYEWGFEAFMEALAQQIVPAIGPSKIFEQMAPCRAIPFGVSGKVSHEVRQNDEGDWECWLTYSFEDDSGFAGIFFETKREALDIQDFKRLKFQLNIPNNARRDPHLEAFKLEGYNRTFPHFLSIENLRGQGWQDCEVDLANYTSGDLDVHQMLLRRVVIADSGGRSALHEEFKLGLRKIRFE